MLDHYKPSKDKMTSEEQGKVNVDVGTKVFNINQGPTSFVGNDLLFVLFCFILYIYVYID